MGLRYTHSGSGFRPDQSIRKGRNVSAVQEELFFVFSVQMIVQQHLLMISQKTDYMPDLFFDADKGINDSSGIGTAVNIIADQHKSVLLRVYIDPGHHLVHFIGASMDIAYGKQFFQERPSPRVSQLSAQAGQSPCSIREVLLLWH
jgi:hypothetical protein